MRVKVAAGIAALCCAGAMLVAGAHARHAEATPAGNAAGNTPGSNGAQTTGEKYVPMNVKTGLWETTMVMQHSGALLPPEVLEKMSPEQRAKMEERMKARGGEDAKPITHRSCLTKEKLEQNAMFEESKAHCVRHVVTSTPSKLEVTAECEHEGFKSTVSASFVALDSENVKGTMHITSGRNGTPMKIDSTFVGKYVGATCPADVD
jgi:hypothetical protein